MWKEKFTVQVHSYHEEQYFEKVEVSQDGKYWTIPDMQGGEIRLPMDDQILSQIMDVCLAIIDHEDNPLN